MKLEYFPNTKEEVVLLYDGTSTEVRSLQTYFNDLATGKSHHLNLHLLPFVNSIAECQLIAKSSTNNSDLWKKGSSEFLWSLNPSEWVSVGELVEPLKKPWEDGFQCLYTNTANLKIILSSGRGW